MGYAWKMTFLQHPDTEWDTLPLSLNPVSLLVWLCGSNIHLWDTCRTSHSKCTSSLVLSSLGKLRSTPTTSKNFLHSVVKIMWKWKVNAGEKQTNKQTKNKKRKKNSIYQTPETNELGMMKSKRFLFILNIFISFPLLVGNTRV